jgi:type II secretory pathway component GspD/PulD (secretin)
LLAVLCLFGAGFANAAEEPAWFSQPYAYVLVDQDVRSALEEFGHNLDVPLVLSEKVRGKARSTLRAATAGEFLQALCSTNGLTWYFDGNLLYLNASDEISTKLFKASALNLDQLQAYLNNLDVFGQQLSMRNGPEGDEVFVSGPPPYLALVQQHVDHLQPRVAAAPAARERGVRVFRGAQVSTETPTQ